MEEYFLSIGGQKMEFTARPTEVVIYAGSVWALKVTRDGILSNPDVSVDDGARAIIEALDVYIKALK